MSNRQDVPGKCCIAWFISPHGFGHAARAAAIMEVIHEIYPTMHFEIFTRVPEFFFKESLEPGSFNYHSLLTDIGLAQKSALKVNLPETLRLLEDFLPFRDEILSGLTLVLKPLNCRLIVCDIAAMGIAAARTLGIPSVLVENFTWEWIYSRYLDYFPALRKHIDYLEKLYDAADFHIRTEPAYPRNNPQLITGPVSRKPRIAPPVIKEKLNLPETAKMVVVSMGGVPEELPFIRQLYQHKDAYFVIPGSPSYCSEANVVRLPNNSGFFHPDLIHAADAVIGKPGYSTVAEVYRAGVPFGYVPRPDFRESHVLETFIGKEIAGIPFSAAEFRNGQWLTRLAELLSLPRKQRSGVTSSEQAGQFILDLLTRCFPCVR